LLVFLSLASVTSLTTHSFLVELSHLSDQSALGILETSGWTPAVVALDAMEKAADVQVWQVELNDFLGTCVKLVGSVENVRSAIEVGFKVARNLHGAPVKTVLSRVSEQGRRGIHSRVEFNPLIQQNVVHEITSHVSTPEPSSLSEDNSMSAEANQALGLIETQGFTAVFEAVDTACKAAQVEVVGKEKLGGGYVTIVIRGDVAAVRAAVDAAKPRVEGLGKLIAAHVIPRPSKSVLALLPK
jgi:microcompartment protein CcmL/EutN